MQAWNHFSTRPWAFSCFFLELLHLPSAFLTGVWLSRKVTAERKLNCRILHILLYYYAKAQYRYLTVYDDMTLLCIVSHLTYHYG